MSLARRFLRLFAPGHATKLDKAEAEAVEAQAVTMFAAAVTASSLPPEYKSALLARGRRGDEPDDAIAYAQDIRDRCFAASNASGKRSLALGPDAIRSNVSAHDLGHSLLEQIAAEDEALQLITTVAEPVSRLDRNGRSVMVSPQSARAEEAVRPSNVYAKRDKKKRR